MQSLRSILQLVAIVGVLICGILGVMLIFDIGVRQEMRTVFVQSLGVLGVLTLVSAFVLLVLSVSPRK